MLDVLRKEIKYIVPLETFSRLEERLGLMMTRDKHSGKDGYIVRTQYYDSVRDTDLFDNLHGLEEKRKIRVRTYLPHAEVVKLEYKGKSNTDGRKMSLLISKNEALAMENGHFEFLLNRDEELAANLYVKILQNGYRPRTIVEYNRVAYAYPVSDLRITFDRFIRGTVDPYGFFDEHLALIPLVNEDQGILEVKYTGFLPAPFRKLLNEIDMNAEGVSKYSLARLLI